MGLFGPAKNDLSDVVLIDIDSELVAKPVVRELRLIREELKQIREALTANAAPHTSHEADDIPHKSPSGD